MKLSDAILLGSTIVRPLAANFYLSPETTGGRPAGCALGMAAIASGMVPNYGEMIVFGGQIGQTLCMQAVMPCACYGQNRLPARIGNIIIHLFDCHVMGGEKDWSFLQLVEWVRQQEPKELPAPAVVEEEALVYSMQ